MVRKSPLRHTRHAHSRNGHAVKEHLVGSGAGANPNFEYPNEYEERRRKDAKSVNPINKRELELYVENDAQLYRQMIVPTYKNLQKKMDKGTYDPQKAEISFKRIADAGAKSYVKEFGGDNYTFSPSDRRGVAVSMRRYFENEYKAGNRW